MSAHPEHDMTCRELVELVTEYLEHALEPGDLARFERHISECDACTSYLLQFRATIALTGSLAAGRLAPQAEGALVALFRSWRGEQ
jgi:anti-sigma factor RsiW